MDPDGTQAAPTHDEDGRDAERPSEIGRRGYWDIARRVKKRVAEDHLAIVAGGVAFWGFLAVFPGLAAGVALWGLVADPTGVEQLFTRLGLPEDAVNLLAHRALELAEISDNRLRWSAIASILIAVWVANWGTKSTFQALNVAYNEDEERGVIRLYATSLAMTAGIVIAFVVAAAAVIGIPALLGKFGLGYEARIAIRWLRWPTMAVLMLLGLAALYRFGPSRRDAKWRWLTPGAVVAMLMWVGGSLGFSAYVNHLADYDRTYGSLGAVAIMLLWFFITSFSFLLGAEINAEFEHQTRKDSTVGEQKPIGERGAYHADNVAKGPRLDPAQLRPTS